MLEGSIGMRGSLRAAFGRGNRRSWEVGGDLEGSVELRGRRGQRDNVTEEGGDYKTTSGPDTLGRLGEILV